jgi:hypothetical protein
MQPGLRRIAPGTPQLTPNRLGSPALREKLEALTQHPHSALLAAPGFDAAPALHTLKRQAAQEHPDAFVTDAADHGVAPLLGWSVRGDRVRGDGPAEIGDCLHALEPAWRLTGLLCLALLEDFAIIDGASACIPWLAVCLPSHWAPEHKVGRHFAEVHGPVADNQVLVAASSHLARLVTGDERWERFVWTLSGDPLLRQHPMHGRRTAWTAAANTAELAAHTVFRTEHQTFIPMPGRHQAIFTIQVQSRPLAEAVGSPEHAQRLHDALASMSPAVLAYRGLTDVRTRLLEWLQDRAQCPPGDTANRAGC